MGQATVEGNAQLSPDILVRRVPLDEWGTPSGEAAEAKRQSASTGSTVAIMGAFGFPETAVK